MSPEGRVDVVVRWRGVVVVKNGGWPCECSCVGSPSDFEDSKDRLRRSGKGGGGYGGDGGEGGRRGGGSGRKKKMRRRTTSRRG